MVASGTPEELEQSFRATEGGGVSGRGAVRRRLLPDSPVDVFTEVRFPSRDWALLVRSDERLGDRDLVLAAGLTCRISSGSIEVVAAPQTERRLFCSLLSDLLDQLQRSGDRPATALARRLTAWQRMLSRGLPTGLPAEQRAGLYGELLVLRDLILPAIGADAVRAWTGPSGSPQDFSHQSTGIEVKTVSRQASGKCRINSEQQLDTTSLNLLYLVHQIIASAPEGSTLAELIDELRDDPRVRVDVAWFENSILEYGWLDAHRGQYAHERYELHRRRCFSVRDDFPRLAPPSLPLGITDVSYLLDLSSCAPYQVDEETIRESLALVVTTTEGEPEHGR